MRRARTPYLQRSIDETRKRLDELGRLHRELIQRLADSDPTDKDGEVFLLMAEHRLFDKMAETRAWLAECLADADTEVPDATS